MKLEQESGVRTPSPLPDPVILFIKQTTSVSLAQPVHRVLGTFSFMRVHLHLPEPVMANGDDKMLM